MLTAGRRVAETYEQVLESEFTYLELGARYQDLPGFRMVWSPGLEDTAGGCQAVRADVTAGETDPRGWVETCEGALRQAKPSLFRMYVHGEAPRLDAQLIESGYQKRLDTVLATPHTEAPAASSVTLRLVETWPEWNLKCLADRESCRAGDPGGDPLFWEESLRRKWVTGKMSCYLIEAGGVIAGTVCSLYAGSYLRVKNLAIRPDFRGQGLGKQAVLAFWTLVEETGSSGIAAVGRGTLTAVFRAAGLREAGWVAEYSRPA